ncbi:hypothetical protein [Halocynthiibacter styelae]|uniref:Uncharacterized protein n=1 Tax=Halocynthiibacter styelae TaxID=2761955 RepID=A0A8J7IVM3_9RHOB|nr:hypothetical protein [Paenihalocynthiibacter styelae]MBI1492430.1 hypothetical protein [Paenihalocynthiibacter styelae]
MNLIKQIAAVTFMSATAALAGNLETVRIDPEVSRFDPITQIEPSCVAYIPNVVLWDHGTSHFVTGIQDLTNLDRRTAGSIARQYCRAVRLNYPDPIGDLRASIEQFM